MNRIREFFAGLTLLSVELIMVLILFIGSLFVFVFITNNIFELKNTGFDNSVFNVIHPHINDFATQIMVIASFFGSHYFLLPANILLACYFLFFRKHPWNSVAVPVVSLGSFLVMSSLKIFFSRPRPLYPVYEAARGFSYPSGHAMSAMTFYGLLIYIVYENVRNKTMKWLLILMLSLVIIVVGFSRVYLRVHYASDVLAGFSLGLIWLIISLWVIKKVGPRVGERIEQRAANNK